MAQKMKEMRGKKYRLLYGSQISSDFSNLNMNYYSTWNKHKVYF